MTNQSTADQLSEDPLADSIYMILDAGSDDMPERHLVCSYSERTGLSFIGMPSETLS